MNKCYYDGRPCNCGAMDVVHDCPRDPYVHEDDDVNLEDIIEEEYSATRRFSNGEEDVWR